MAYSAAEIKSAIDISRSQGFSDADIATGLGRYLPDAASVTAALAANPKVVATTATTTADTTAATTYTPTQIKSAIDVSRAQGFSDADIATGLGRYLPDAAAVTTALAANPRPVATTTTTSTTGTGGTATTAGTGGTASTTGTGGTSTTVPRTYTQDEITSAINISRQQGFSDAEIAIGLSRYLSNDAAVRTALAANPRAATTTATTAPRVYTSGEIASAIAVSRQQGFSDADIATGLGRYLPNAAAVTAALAANPRAATTAPVARTYSAAEITSAINTSRQQGFSEADIATGLGRYLPNATAVTAALAANPRAATTATGATAGAPQGLLATGQQGFNPNIVQPQRTYTSMTPGRITDTPIYNNTGTYTPEQIQSAIAVSKGQGFSDADIATGLARYGVTQTPYRNLYTPESVRQVYQSPQVMDAIRTSRAQGFNESDVRTGLLRYLSPQDADAAIAASLAPAPAATGGLLSTATPVAAPNPYAAIRAATPAFTAPSSLNLGGTGGFDSSLYGQDKYKAPVAEVLANSLNGSGGGGGGNQGTAGGSYGTYSGLTGTGSILGQAPAPLGADFSSVSEASRAESNFGKESEGIAVGGETSNAGNDHDGGMGGGGEGNGSNFYMGGNVRSLMSPNPPGPDDGYGSLQRGEYVIKKSAVDKYGEGLLGMINNGKVSARKLKSLLE
jgi:hypothetical protein